MARSYTIITTCMGRLEHLKQSLPRMVAQPFSEVIVVDYSCPQGTGDLVASDYPSVRLVSVEGEKHFSNWKARNAGAAAATGEVLVFVDADIVLAENAIDALDRQLPKGAYGSFDRQTSWASGDRTGLAANQLKGFLVIPAAIFRRLGGYDDVLEGYAAGADTDLEDRMPLIRVAKHSLDPAIIAEVLHHDSASRTENHAHPLKVSYCAGLLYRAAKFEVLCSRRTINLPIKLRRKLFDAALAAAREAAADEFQNGRVSLVVKLRSYAVLMPRQLGHKKASQTISLRVDVELEDRLDRA